MAEGKKAFVLYCDIIHTVEKLTKEQAGDLFKHILRYVNDQNPEPNDLITELTFEPIKQQLKRDLQRYKVKQAKRIEAGRLGGLKSGASRKEKNEANEANASICEPSENTDEQRNQSELKQSKRKQAEANEANASFSKQNEQVIDTVTVTVTGKDKDKERENINTHSPVRVSISELFEFLNQNQIWKEQVCMANHCKMEETEEAIAEFVARQKAENVEWKYTQDAYSHFSNWFRIQLEKKKKEKNERAKKNQLSAADKDEELLRHVAQGIERANAQRAAREQRG